MEGDIIVDKGGTFYLERGYAKDFQEMILRVKPLEATDDLIKKIRDENAEQKLEVKLSFNSPLRIISVQRIEP